jgi:hypothetical protein
MYTAPGGVEQDASYNLRILLDYLASYSYTMIHFEASYSYKYAMMRRHEQ